MKAAVILAPSLVVVAVGCERGQMSFLPLRRGATVVFDAAQPAADQVAPPAPDQIAPPAPDHAAPPPPRFDGGQFPPPFGGMFECSANDQCGGRRRFCDTRTRHCVECLDSFNCQRPLSCDPLTLRCELFCQNDGDCSMTAQTRCDPARHVCAGCTSNGQCAAPTPYCEPSFGQCVECLGDADCAPPWKFCSFRSECVECVNDQNCAPGQVCGGGGRCFTP